MKRVKLNCFVVAMWLWAASRGKDWVSVRRSRWFKGLVPHFSTFRGKGRYCLHVEYVPNRKQGDPKEAGDCLAIFPGVYRATLYRRVGMVETISYRDSIFGVFKQARRAK